MKMISYWIYLSVSCFEIYSCCCLVTKSCPTVCDFMNCSMPGFPVLYYLPEFAQTHESVMPSKHLILCHPLLLLPSVFPSIGVFSSELALCIKWAKYWRLSFSISPSSEYSGLISLRIDQFDLLAIQGTFKSLLQHHSLKASILWCSAFFMVHLSHQYMSNGKTITLRWVYGQYLFKCKYQPCFFLKGELAFELSFLKPTQCLRACCVLRSGLRFVRRGSDAQKLSGACSLHSSFLVQVSLGGVSKNAGGTMSWCLAQ